MRVHRGSITNVGKKNFFGWLPCEPLFINQSLSMVKTLKEIEMLYFSQFNPLLSLCSPCEMILLRGSDISVMRCGALFFVRVWLVTFAWSAISWLDHQQQLTDGIPLGIAFILRYLQFAYKVVLFKYLNYHRGDCLNVAVFCVSSFS